MGWIKPMSHSLLTPYLNCKYDEYELIQTGEPEQEEKK